MAVPMPREPETLEQAMTTLKAEITEALNRGDAEACQAFYADDATVLVPDLPPVKGRDAIKSLLEDYAAAGTKLASIEPLEVSSSGDLGYCAGTYRFDTPAEDGSTLKETGKFVSVFRLQADGSWKAVIDSMIRDSANGSP